MKPALLTAVFLPPSIKMKSYLKILTVACAACFASSGLFAADSVAAATATASVASPAGTWKWSQPGRDGSTFEQTLELAYDEGKLTGKLLGATRGDMQIPAADISDASFKDGTVAFSVAREFNGNRIVSKYEGKLEGDSIKGSFERPSRDGGAPRKNDWNATRAK
jgi:hypothetical protein